MEVAACKGAYAAVLSAKLVGNVIRIHYRDPVAACSAIAESSMQPTVHLVELL